MKSLVTQFLTLIFLVLSRCSNAYKMVIFVPDITNSQVIFTGRVAETLAKAGHDVTMVLITGFTDRDSSDVKIMKEVSIYRVNASFGVTREEVLGKQTEMIFTNLPMWDYRMRDSMKIMSTLLLETCRRVTENKEFLDWLVAQKFDLAFPYMADACPIGLVEYAKIPSWIWLSSAGLIDYAAYYIGAPILPSYVPQKDGILEKFEMAITYYNTFQEFQQIVDKSEGLVVFSFGSVAPSHLMPETWKTAFLEAFSRFPKLHFVLRYEGTDLKGVSQGSGHVESDGRHPTEAHSKHRKGTH
ncbi:hypothetical protein GCK32_007246 [Trichostrongylus colubriformis]|uniref:glucuronosyltransferase n=1 Tax=Trichostrongylus colubriformis TaxID=6319 RepID=A0AAN8J2K4_TRICO